MMRYDAVEGQYVMASGRRFGAKLGILGLGQGSETLFQGYDDTVSPAFNDDDFDLTPAERREIAEEMVARWMAWGAL